MKTVGAYGVVTAISDNLWEDYLLFHLSIMRFNSFMLYVVDVGLNDNQRQFVRQQSNTSLITLSQKAVEYWSTIDSDWRKWYKVAFFQAAVAAGNLAIALWLDADIIVTGSLVPLFAQAEQQFFVIQDYFAPQYCFNKEELHQVHEVSQAPLALNSGVWGGAFPRDQDIMAQWLKLVEQAHVDAAIYDGITLHDQGALLLALCILKRLETIKSNRRWNCPAQRLYYDDGADLITMIIADHPDMLIIHYAGTPKLSTLRQINHQRGIEHFKKRCGTFTTTKLFITGTPDIIGPLVEAFRTQTKIGGWFRALELTQLALPRELIRYWDRCDCPYSVTASSAFGWVFSKLAALWPHAHYITLISDPCAAIRHQLLTFRIWPHKLIETSGEYQVKYHEAVRKDKALHFRNKHRIISQDGSLIELCLADLLGNLEAALQSNAAHRYYFLGTLPELSEKIAAFTTDQVMLTDSNTLETVAWVDEALHTMRTKIMDAFYGLLTRYRVIIPRAFL